MPRIYTRRPIAERAMDKFIPEPNSGCWLWIGSAMNGYGRIRLGSKSEGTVAAHRVIYEALRGPVPDGLELDHLCRNPSCVNPDHMEPVTHRENTIRGDAMKNGWWHREKTHCPQGHPYSPENTRFKGGPRRRFRACRACSRIADKRRYWSARP